MKKKVVYILIAMVVIIALIATGVFAYSSTRISDEEIFRAYVEKGVTSTKATQLETYEGTGSKTTLKGTLDTQKKALAVTADVVCTTTSEGKEISIDMSVQQENAKGYYRVNSASGSITNSEGDPLDLPTVFSKIKGVWYSAPELDKATKAQLDSGVYLFSTSVMAPGYDSTKVVDALITKKAFTYSSIEKVDGNYVISFTAHRDKYIEVAKEMFPNLSNIDLIMDSIFEKKSSFESTITVDKNGTQIKEKLTNTNLCVDMISTFVGIEAKDLAESLTGVNEAKPHGSITITPITDSKPIDQLTSDFVF